MATSTEKIAELREFLEPRLGEVLPGGRMMVAVASQALGAQLDRFLARPPAEVDEQLRKLIVFFEDLLSDPAPALEVADTGA